MSLYEDYVLLSLCNQQWKLYLERFQDSGLSSVVDDLARQEVELDVRMFNLFTGPGKSSGLEVSGG